MSQSRTDNPAPLLYPLAAGVILLPLLPLGIWIGTGSFLFDFTAIVHLIVWFGALRAALRSLAGTAKTGGLLERSLFGATLFFLAVTAVIAAAPVVNRDALIHHLAVPRWWAEAGTIHPIEWHEWSYYPMLLQLQYLFFEKYGLARLAGLYHCGYLVMLCGAAAAFLKNRGSARAGLTAAFLLAALPLSIRTAAAPMVDLGLALYSFLALAWLAEGASRVTLRPFLYAGLALGLALGCKYNALLLAFIVAVLSPLYAGTPPRAARYLARTGALFGIALLIFAPWMLKNYAWTGNPIFPLFNNHFSTTIEFPPGLPVVRPLEHRLRIYGETPLQVALLPLRMLFEGRDDDPQAFDGVLSPLLLLALVPIVLQRGSARWISFFGCAMIFFTVFELFYAPLRVRYLFPIAGCAAVLAAMGAERIGALYRRGVPAAALVLCLQLLLSLPYALRELKHSRVAELASGRLEAADYLRARIPEYELIERANRALPSTARIYLLYTGNRYYHYRGGVFSGGHFSASWLVSWIKKSISTDQLAGYFRRYGLTHLLAHTALSQSALNELLDDRETELWIAFVKERLTPLDQSRGFALWRVDSGAPL